MKSTATHALKALVLGLCFLGLQSCLGTEAKTLGNKSSANAGGSARDMDSFAVTVAYRNDVEPDTAASRIITIQGSRDSASAGLASLCGASGTSCTCQFYTSTSDTSPLSADPSVGLSATNNTFTCSIPSSTDPDAYGYVKLKMVSGSKSTGYLQIKTSLELSDIIGSLSQSKVRGIYRYGCTRTFLEGEGVGLSTVDCVWGQRLGLITAPYYFYVYNSQEGDAGQGGFYTQAMNSAVPFDTAICEKQLTKTSCTGSTPELRYGLYGERAGPFTISISMTFRPEGETTNATMGYAALPDTAGNCPLGLVKIRPYVAKPQSIIQGSINGTNPPSSFVNVANNLDSTVVEDSSPSTNFLVSRAPNLTPCNAGTGSCASVAFAGTSQVQSVAFTGSSPVVCAIPKEKLSGLF